MTTKKTGSRKPKKGRNVKGQWLPGVCGNKEGRGARKKPLPKCLTEQLADEMSKKVAVTDERGKQLMVTLYDAVAQRLAQGLLDPGLKTKDLIPAVKWMDEYFVFATMRQRAEEATEPAVTREDLELLKTLKSLMAANAAEMRMEERERGAPTKVKAKLRPKAKQPHPRKTRQPT